MGNQSSTALALAPPSLIQIEPTASGPEGSARIPWEWRIDTARRGRELRGGLNGFFGYLFIQDGRGSHPSVRPSLSEMLLLLML